MNKYILKSILALAVIISAASCETLDYNEQYFGDLGYDSNPEITDVQNVVLTLSESDYSTIASNYDNIALAESLGLSSELSAISSTLALTENITAELFIPELLSTLYGEYLTSGSTAKVTYNYSEAVVSGGEAIILEGGEEGFPTVAPSGSITINDVSVEYDNVYLYYGGFGFAKSVGYFVNSSALTDLTEIVITEDYTFYNLTVYVGTDSSDISTAVSYTKTGDDYVYTIPAGSTYFTIMNESTYTASADKITFTCGSVDYEIPVAELPTDSPSGTLTVNGYELAYDNAYYNSYGSYTVPAGSGSISNVTELEDLSRIVATDDYSYYNFTLYVGATVDDVTTKVEFTQEGDDRIYDIPAGNGFFKFVNESTYSAYADKITFTCGEVATTDVVSEQVTSFCLSDGQWGPKSYLVLSDNTTMPDSGSQTGDINTFEVEGAKFEYMWAYYYSYYGSFTVPSNCDGYICNVTELPGLSKVVITEDYAYYNLELYAGTSSGAEDILIEYTKSGNDYTYTIPEGYNFVKIVNNTIYTAYCDVITFEFNGLE